MPSPKRVINHRDRMRKQGFKLRQIWVQDVKREGFADEAERQIQRAIAADKRDPDVDAFTNQVFEDSLSDL